MAIPVHLQQFKAAGIYRVVFDKSTVLGVDAEVLRLVVGYSEQGPFNIPTYITSVSDFRAIYGDISKKLEKRGVFFHRTAIQALGSGPILCLNLKKFDGETLDGASINTNFNPTFEPIETVKLYVEDIYDTTRFWELSADKLNNLRAADGTTLSQYINLCTTNTSKTSVTYFIRKASGNALNGYNITVSDWYADKAEEMPDYLEHYGNAKISDFFAEIYVFNGKFTASQVLASTTLKNYFEVEVNEEDKEEPKLKLRSYVLNAYGEYIDTLDALYNDPSSGAIGHYIGSLIPYFKNKQGAYASLDIVFNGDNDIHNMMMTFNTDLLDDVSANQAYIDLSGRLSIPSVDPTSAKDNPNILTLDNLFGGEAETTLLGNNGAKVIVDKPEFINSVVTESVEDDTKLVPIIPFNTTSRRVLGTMYVSEVDFVTSEIHLRHIGSDTVFDKTYNEVIIKATSSETLPKGYPEVVLEPSFEKPESEPTLDEYKIESSTDGDEVTYDEEGYKKALEIYKKQIKAWEEYEEYQKAVEEYNADPENVKVTDETLAKYTESIKLNLFIKLFTLGAASRYPKAKWDKVYAHYAEKNEDSTVKYSLEDNLFKPEGEDNKYFYALNETGVGTYYKNLDNIYAGTDDNAFINDNFEFVPFGPQKVITSITRIETADDKDFNHIKGEIKVDEENGAVTKNMIYNYTDNDGNMNVSITDVICQSKSNTVDSVYGSSVTFLPLGTENSGWQVSSEPDENTGLYYLYCKAIYDNTLLMSLSVGDCLLSEDGFTDWDGDGEKDKADGYYDNVYVQRLNTISDELTGVVTEYRIYLSGEPLIYDNNKSELSYLVRVDAPLNQEIGTMYPQYLEGYTYKNSKPTGTSMSDKLDWQKFILSTLTEYKGLRIGLLNKSDIDYRYIVDTFESYVDEECKSVLSYLAKEKQSAFAILNFPAIKTFIKCPYSSYTTAKGVFDVQYIVDGANRKKPAAKQFSLPSDANGASFCAFYTPLRFSDGYVDTVVPAAGLVSNLFMEKYTSRQPYYIIAGPNYGRISTSGLVGPDYKYSQDELNIIEPYGVNCMIYRPGFGTFINANQTAKQTPVSALSKVNVRELVIYLQDEIEKVLQAYQWEFNNARTRNAILDKANAICGRVLAAGGLQAYLNVMDESNNTPEIIDNEMAVLSTHIEPGMGCGKMVHELTIYRTGQMSASVITE